MNNLSITKGMLAKENIQDIYTLSPLQEGMYLQSLQQLDSITYFQQQTFYQTGVLDVQNVERSLISLFERHDILRTVYVFKKEKPLQVVLKERKPDFYFEDVSALNDPEGRLLKYKQADKDRFFDLNKSSLMRMAVFKINDREFVTIWSWHHILMDAWCVSILKNEFLEIYEGLCNGHRPVLPQRKPFRNYITWLEKQDRDSARQFWSAYLQGYDRVAGLPQKDSLVNPAVYDWKESFMALDGGDMDFFKELSVINKVTINAIFQTIWGVLLAKYNNRRDVVFGTVVSGRPAEIDEVESMIGLFINTLPVRIKYDEDTSFVQLLKSVAESAREAEKFGYCSLADIQSGCELKQGLVESLFLFQNYLAAQPGNQDQPSKREGSSDELRVVKSETFEQYFYQFNFFVIPGDTLSILVKYNSHVYDPAMVTGVLQHFKNIVHQLKLNIEINIADIGLVSSEERSAILASQNGKSFAVSGMPVHRLFEQQVIASPASYAVGYKGDKWTYQELNVLSNRLAHYVKDAFTLTPGAVAGVLLERSERAIVALLAIWKAGVAFLPIDPGLPKERIRYMIQDAGCTFVLTDADLLHLVQGLDTGMVALDVQLSGLETSSFNPPASIGGEDLAYLMYTSGSTGGPKGVRITHNNLGNYLQWANLYYFQDKGGYTFPLFTSLSFDLTLTSIFSTLLRGDMIEIYNQPDVQQDLASIFGKDAVVNAIKLTPAHIGIVKMLDLRRSHVRLAIVGGEPLTNEQVATLRSLNPLMKIFNEYGPTETTIGSTVKEIADAADVITIGTPIFNTGVFILNGDGNVQPAGLEGEIHITGKGVGLGYHRLPELTEKTFVSLPGLTQGIVYKTGDLGRLLTNGEIDYIGRGDKQVKVRGYRIDLGEVEQALSKFPSIREAIVLKSEGDDQQLLAYYTGDGSIDTGRLKVFLAGSLPSYMIPGQFIAMEKFPLTVNGKVDRRRLPAADKEIGECKSLLVMPENAVERKLAEMWCAILDKEVVGITEKFFDLGGHSLKAVQLASRISKEFQVQLGLGDILEGQTIRQLAERILQAKKVKYDPIAVVEEQEYYPVSHAQRRMLIVNSLYPGNHAYNIAKGYILRGQLNIAALEKSFRAVIQRHESLRTRFVILDWDFKQRIDDPEVFTFGIDHFEVTPEQEDLDLFVKRETDLPFDLEKGPLLRAKIFNLNGGKYLFLLTVHHIISDRWSRDILLHEILKYYRSFCEGKGIGTRPLKLHYKEFAVWQNRQLSPENAAAHRNYWLKVFEDDIPVLNFPTDYVRPAQRTFNGGAEKFAIDKDVCRQLEALAKGCDASVFVVLLAALKAAVAHHANQTDVVIGSVTSGRDHLDLEDQIGFYMNAFPLRTRFSGDERFDELVQKVKMTTIGALEHQGYPFDLLIEALKINRASNRAPLFDVVISYQRQDGHIEIGEMEMIEADDYVLTKDSVIYDLIIDIQHGAEELFVTINYNSDLFRKETVRGFGISYRNVLEKAAGTPFIKIDEMDLSGNARPVAVALDTSFDINFG